MAATTIDVIRRLTVQGQTVGMDKVAADLEKVEAGQDAVAQSSARLVTATATTERSVLGVSRQLDNYTRSLDPLSRALAQQERGERLAAAARAEGLSITDAQARAMANAAARVDELKRATEGHTAATSLNRGAQMQLRAATSAFIDQVQAGTPVFTAARIQAADFYEALSSDKGGLTGGVKTVGASLVRLATGWQGVALGVTATIGAGALAANAYVEGQRRMAAALTGTGRAAGLTLAQLNDVASTGAKLGGISIGSSQDLAGSFARVGIGGATSESLIGSAPAYSRATGVDLADGGKALAMAFADPEKGAADLNKNLGFLNDRVLTAIHVQEASGNMEGARRVLLEAYLTSLKDVTQQTNFLAEVFDKARANVGNFISDFGKEASKAFGGQSNRDQLKSLQDRLPFTSNYAPGYFNTDFVKSEIDRLQKVVDSQDVRERGAAAQAKAKSEADTLSLQAREIVRGLLPELDRKESFQTRSGVLTRAIGNPGGLTNAADATRALGMLTAQNAFSDPMLIMQQDAKLALQAVNATSLAERAAIEARRAELAVLRETGDVAKAAAAAQNAMNVEMAKTRKEAEDRLESSRQELAMVGKTPFQRGLMDIDNQFKGKGGIFEKDAATSTQISAALVPVQADLRAAGDTLAQVLRDVAEKAKTAFLSVDGKPVGNPYGSLAGVKGSMSDAQAIKAIESSGGNYGALGPVTKSGDRAFGAYQVMGANIPSWSRQALGYSLTPSQFVADPAAQDAVFNHQFGLSKARYGNASDAASVWFTGRPMAQGAGARDVLGTSGAGYVSRFEALTGRGSANAIIVRPDTTDSIAALAADKGAYANKRQAYIGDQFGAPLKSANEALDQQIKLLGVQQSTMGKSAAEIQAAAKAQELWNTYTAMDPNREAGADVWKKLADGVEEYRTKMQGVLEKQAQVNKQSQTLIDNMDGVRDASKGALSTFIEDLRNGQTAGKALQDVMSGLTDKLLDKAENSLIDSLFGKSGTSATGGTGGMMGGFLHTAFPSIFHEGGIVGGDAPIRMVPAAAFAGAPRYHTGMGLSHDERPAILQTGEAVISRADLSAARAQKGQAMAAEAGTAGAGGAPIINITNESNGAQVTDVRTSRKPDGSHVIHARIVDAVVADMQSNGKIAQMLQKRTGAGRVG